MPVNEGATPEAPLEPALDFLRGLWELNHSLERLSTRMDRTLGVTAQQRLIVRCVGKYPGMTAGQLASFLHLDPGSVSAALKRLEEKRLLARRRDPRDQRRVTVALTAKGRTLDRPTPGTVEHVVERLFMELGEEKIAAAKGVIVRLSRLVEAAAGKP